MTTTTKSVFAKHQRKSFPYLYAATIHVSRIAGGTPSNSRVAEAWIKTKIADRDALVVDDVARIMAERGLSEEQAVEQAAMLKSLNGFKRDEHGLYIEGRQLKACIKEAANVAVAAGKLGKRGWGETNKGLLGFIAEHVFVTDEKLSLGVTEATGIMQRFVSTFRGTGIQYEEYVDDADIHFEVEADHLFKADEWATIWTTAERQGIGASRSQGYGRFTVTRWERVA